MAKKTNLLTVALEKLANAYAIGRDTGDTIIGIGRVVLKLLLHQ
jgi:hypothetical protein